MEISTLMLKKHLRMFLMKISRWLLQSREQTWLPPLQMVCHHLIALVFCKKPILNTEPLLISATKAAAIATPRPLPHPALPFP